MRRLAIAIVLAGVIGAACAQTGSGSQSLGAGGCPALADALRGCAPASCRHAHPLVATFTIEHRVTGLDGAHCGYTQTVPGDMLMSCRFTADGRSEMAELITEMVRGNLSGGTGRESVVTRECEVRDRDGTLLPWG
jgi:hypothetical protein